MYPESSSSKTFSMTKFGVKAELKKVSRDLIEAKDKT